MGQAVIGYFWKESTVRALWRNATIQQKIWSLFLLTGFLLRLFIAWSDILVAFQTSMPDDAFYYFQIARNIARGAGSTFDGLTPTNGYHPLWMVTLVPIYRFFEHDAELPIHVALSLASVVDLITAIIVYKIVSRAVKWQPAALLVSATYFLNPYSVLAATNGLETMVAALCFVLSIWWYERIKAESNPSWPPWAVLGGLLGLLLLARTDYIFFAAALNIDALLRLKPVKRKVKALIILNSVVLLTLAPWLVWNLVKFGSIMQVSGAAYPYYQRTAKLAEWGSYASVAFLKHELTMAYKLGAHLARLSGIGKVLPFLMALIAAVILLDQERDRRRQVLGVMANFIYVVVGASIPVMFNGLWRWMILPWYFVPSVIMVTLYVGFALCYLGRRARTLPYVLAALLFVFYGFQYDHLQRAGWLEEQAEAASTLMPAVQEMCQHEPIIGISDSGYIGYYADCTVVNLDGVVNNQAFLALKGGTFIDYLQANGINYVMLNQHIYPLIENKDRLVREGQFWKVLPE